MKLVKPIIAVSGDLIRQLPGGISCWNHGNKVGLGGWSHDLRHHLVICPISLMRIEKYHATGFLAWEQIQIKLKCLPSGSYGNHEITMTTMMCTYFKDRVKLIGLFETGKVASCKLV
jgi:hypothetical protein